MERRNAYYKIQKRTGIFVTVLGAALLSLNFISYLANNSFILKSTLPLGIIMVVIGIVLVKSLKKNPAGPHGF